MRHTALLALLIATNAHANVWTDATKSDSSRELYAHEMAAGDELARDANSQTISPAEIGRFIASSVEAYRAAAKARPEAAEPYFRIGRLLYSFYFECEDGDGWRYQLQHPPLADCRDGGGYELFDPVRAQQIIDAWDEFEARAPLDPRLDHDELLLFRRAILHTKFATPDHLAHAAHDYEEILDRLDPAVTSSTTRNNLAETYMMLDKLPEAIEMYQRAVREDPTPSTSLGLAVALDRSGSSDQAREEILSLGGDGIDKFREELRLGTIFFVPDGERYYYTALIAEATGDYAGAVELWRKYIQSGAHREFQPRAKQHIATLTASPKAPPHDAPYREVPP